MLQGGDCAETFADVTAANIQGKLRTLLSMAVVLTYAQVPIVKVGRMAGQPRLPEATETRRRHAAGVSRRCGERLRFTAEAREPDPHRLLEVYRLSAT